MEVGDYVAVMDGNRIVTLGWVDMAGRFDETIGCQRFRVNNGEASIYYTGLRWRPSRSLPRCSARISTSTPRSGWPESTSSDMRTGAGRVASGG